MKNNPIGTEKTAMQQIILRDLIFLLNWWPCLPYV